MAPFSSASYLFYQFMQVQWRLLQKLQITIVAQVTYQQQIFSTVTPGDALLYKFLSDRPQDFAIVCIKMKNYKLRKF